jgi:hypothetical protein
MRRSLAILALSSCTLAPLCAQQSPKSNAPAETKILDNSDWWSLNSKPFDQNSKSSQPQRRAVSTANFSILGVTLDQHTFEHADARLGRTTRVNRGDASTGRSQICYVSGREPAATYLIFERGEVDFSFYLFKAAAHWNGDKYCVLTPRLSALTTTGTGIHLGMDQTAVIRILGIPVSRSATELTFALEPAKHSSMSYQSFDARFTSGQLTYFSASYTDAE